MATRPQAKLPPSPDHFPIAKPLTPTAWTVSVQQSFSGDEKQMNDTLRSQTY